MNEFESVFAVYRFIFKIEKILQQRVKSPEDVSQLTADLVDILSGGDRTVTDIVTTTRVFKYIPSIHVQDEQAFRNLAQVKRNLKLTLHMAESF